MEAPRYVQSLLLVATLFLSVSTLSAQDYSLFLMGGGTSLFDTNSFTTNFGTFNSAYSTGGQFSAGVEAPLTGPLGLEGSYGWGQNNLGVTQVTTLPETKYGYGIRTQRVSGDLVAHAPSLLGLHPYLLAGVEYDRFSPYGSARLAFPDLTTRSLTATLAPSNHVGFNYGGGFEVRVFPHIGLRLDIRDHMTGSPAYGLPPQSSTGPFFPTKATANDVEYSVGVVLHLGK